MTGNKFTKVDRDAVARHKASHQNAGFDTLTARKDEIEDLLGKVVDAAGDDFDITSREVGRIDGFAGSPVERCEKLVDLHSELSAIEDVVAKQHEARRVIEEISLIREQALRDAHDSPQGQQAPSQVRRALLSDCLMAQIGEEAGQPISANFNVNDARKMLGGSIVFESEADVRSFFAAVVTTDAGWDPFVVRQPGMIPAISRPLQVNDVFPMSMTDQHSIKYMMATTRDASNVVEKAEGAASGEATMIWTERTEEMREIPAHIPVTEIQLEDEAQVRAIIEMDLRMMVLQRLDAQLVNGNGNAPNIAGILASRFSGAVSGAAASANRVAIAFYNFATTGSGANTRRNDQIKDLRRGKRQCRWASYSMPNVYLVNQMVWEEVALSETTSAGFYLGSPATEFTDRIWGLPVVETDHLSDANNGTNAVVMDTMWTRHWVRRAIHSEIGYNNDDFTKRQLTFRAAIRCCLQVTRPQAVLAFRTVRA